jgi:hypothetical protein
VDGVLVIPPPGEKALRSLSKAIAAEYGLQVERDGKMAMINLNARCAADIAAAIKNGQLICTHDAERGWIVTDLAGNTVALQEVFDKAMIHRLMSQTAVGVAWPNSSAHPCSPEHTHEFAVGESGDDWQSLKDNLPEALAQFNELKARGFVRGVVLPKDKTGLDEDIKVDVQVECTVGADQSGSHSGLGLGPCNSSCSCPICHIGQNPQDDLLETNEACLKKHTRRSLAGIRLLAHLVPGDCPGCNARIVASAAELCKCKPGKRCEKCEGHVMMVVAKVGDDPPPMKKSDLDSWLKRHFGVYYAKGPLIEVEPGLWVICILHMNLRITGAMYEHIDPEGVGSPLPRQFQGERGNGSSDL